MDTQQHLDTAGPITGPGVRTARPGTVKARVARGGAVRYGSKPQAAKLEKVKLTAKEQIVAIYKAILTNIAGGHPDAVRLKQELDEFKDLLG